MLAEIVTGESELRSGRHDGGWKVSPVKDVGEFDPDLRVNFSLTRKLRPKLAFSEAGGARGSQRRVYQSRVRPHRWVLAPTRSD